MKLSLRSKLILALAWVLRAIRMIGESDYEHQKFHMWFVAYTKAHGTKLTNVTQHDDLKDLQEAAR